MRSWSTLRRSAVVATLVAVGSVAGCANANPSVAAYVDGTAISQTQLDEAVAGVGQTVDQGQQVSPQAVAASSPEVKDGVSIRPSLDPTSVGFSSQDSLVDAQIPRDPDAPLRLQTLAGPLLLDPLNISNSASLGQAVGDNAVAYAGTNNATDTVVRATATGLESFTGLESPAAPNAFSWHVGLPGEEVLDAQPDGSVNVLDPTPKQDPTQAGAKPADQAIDPRSWRV